MWLDILPWTLHSFEHSIQFTHVLALYDPFGVDVPLNFDITHPLTVHHDIGSLLCMYIEPENILKENLHHRNIRNRKDLHILQSRNYYGDISIKVTGTKLYSKLPQNLKDSKTQFLKRGWKTFIGKLIFLKKLYLKEIIWRYICLSPTLPFFQWYFIVLIFFKDL